jgi:hypothetical protein
LTTRFSKRYAKIDDVIGYLPGARNYGYLARTTGTHPLDFIAGM